MCNIIFLKSSDTIDGDKPVGNTNERVLITWLGVVCVGR
jgi:hypothetical protein